MCAPNKDTPEFFKQMLELIALFEVKNLILCRDWNLPLNHDIDTFSYVTKNNQKSSKFVNDIMEKLDLLDIWHYLNPGQKKYTWFLRQPLKGARLDYFFYIKINFASFLKRLGTPELHT